MRVSKHGEASNNNPYSTAAGNTLILKALLHGAINCSYNCNRIAATFECGIKVLLHGAINCINMQLKLTKRAIDCSSFQFLVSQHVLKFIAQTSNLSQRCQRHDSL